MYLDFYGLKENPFTLSPNPRFLYLSESHKEALSQLVYTITQGYGFMCLIGEVGTGKTTLLNTILEKFPNQYNFATIYHTALTQKGLIQNICNEFGIKYSNETRAGLIFLLQEYFEWNFQQGKKPVIILDEAQNLNINTLEELRLLSNIEGASQKYLQILLIGQPELNRKLNSAALRQLKDRINLTYYLSPLKKEEISRYIWFRLKKAGADNHEKIFSEDAFEKVYDHSRGIPRKINILCENSLLTGYSKNIRTIGVSVIADSLENLPVPDNHRGETKGGAPAEDSTPDREGGQMHLPGEKSQLETDSASTTKTKFPSSSSLVSRLEEIKLEKVLAKFFAERELFLLEKLPRSVIFKWLVIFFTLMFGASLLAFLIMKQIDFL